MSVILEQDTEPQIARYVQSSISKGDEVSRPGCTLPSSRDNWDHNPLKKGG